MTEEQENLLMREKYRRERYMLISNTIRVIGFIILAIAFNHWWISLLSILFWTYLKDEKSD